MILSASSWSRWGINHSRVANMAFRLSVERSTPYPKNPTTIGEHILKRRCELELFQKDVGQQIGVCSCTIMNWEKGSSTPEIRYYPAIISFLGYEPFPEPHTQGEMIRFKRQSLGLTQRQFAELINVDPSTIYQWEHNDRKPLGRASERLAQFLANDAHRTQLCF
ncbi:helix-turn-helix domain-containing protein [Kordiimonas aestuarii]|uniref:helix-turn-helix domain-containing protein n=1 Tax=Kordiimonas aestuarii TaxID=1005925 RepID=UPI0021D1949B|nr:helix-turn-helix domain-containing protein [Kordiimonas aestuarii]